MDISSVEHLLAMSLCPKVCLEDQTKSGHFLDFALFVWIRISVMSYSFTYLFSYWAGSTDINRSKWRSSDVECKFVVVCEWLSLEFWRWVNNFANVEFLILIAILKHSTYRLIFPSFTSRTRSKGFSTDLFLAVTEIVYWQSLTLWTILSGISYNVFVIIFTLVFFSLFHIHQFHYYVV